MTGDPGAAAETGGDLADPSLSESGKDGRGADSSPEGGSESAPVSRAGRGSTTAPEETGTFQDNPAEEIRTFSPLILISKAPLDLKGEEAPPRARRTSLIRNADTYKQPPQPGPCAMPDLKEPSLEDELEEIRAGEDPRGRPERPYTPEWDHLADVWPEEVKGHDGGPYRAEWKEERPGFGLVRCEMETPSLLKARKAAQRASLLERCSIAWVTLPDGTVDHDLHRSPGQDRDTVDVWSCGLRLPNHHWTKEGHPPHHPGSGE
jgi:hypothetical protein